MDNQTRWLKIKSQLDQATKDLIPKNRFAINDKIMKRAEKIMTKKSLSLIYDEYGNQIYEKTSDIQNFISCKKTGGTFLLLRDDNKLIETQTSNDEFNTDFIAYDSIKGIHEENVKFDMDIDTGFKKHNDYLYLTQQKEKRKEEVINQGIDEILLYINIIGRKELNKIDSNFVGIIG